MISCYLTMLYNAQNYWDSGLCPSPGILNTRKEVFVLVFRLLDAGPSPETQ
jgi:hypothetical protein